MMKRKLPVLLLAVIAFFYISCEKDYSCEGCGGVLIVNNAIYTFNGGTAACTGAMVSGDYIAGNAMSEANTVLLQVLVDSVGSYTVTTNRVNGISFSGAGFFTNTGAQTITLRASGSPVDTGTFHFTAGNAGCSFSITVAPVVDDNFTYYYEANIDGTFYKETVTSTNGFNEGHGRTGTNDVVLFSTILPVGYPPMPVGKTGMEVSKGILTNYPARNNTEFKTFFNLGNYDYTATPLTSDGVSISWYDQNGTVWKTANAPADQSGSRCAIVQVEETPLTSIYTVAITFTFDCKLYDANGNVKTLTGGRYKGIFVKE